MSTMRTLAVCLLATVLGAAAHSSVVFQRDFTRDDAALIVQFRDHPEQGGGYDLTVTREGRRSLRTQSWSAGLPGAHQGVLTVWQYDDLGAAWRSVRAGFQCVEAGKPAVSVAAHLSQISTSNYYCSSRHGSIHPDRINWPLRREAGWHRYEFVLPAGDGPRQVRVCLDGRLVYTQPEPVTSFADVGISADYGGPLWIDSIVLDDDPAAFKPDWLKPLTEGLRVLDLPMCEGRKVAVTVPLADDPCVAGDAELRARWVDWYQRDVRRTTVAFTARPGATVPLEVDAPPTDGLYWLKLDALRDGKTVGHCSTKVRLSWELPPPPAALRAAVDLSGFWDFKPEKIGNDNGTLLTRGWQKWYVPWPLPLGRLVDVQEAAYRREVDIPASWTARRVLLEIHEPQVKATVSVNGRQAGVIEWPGGKLDVTDLVTPGSRAIIEVFLETGNNAEMRKLLLTKLGKLPAEYMTNRENRHGLCGAVTLETAPGGPRVEGMFIRPQASPKALRLDAEVGALTPGQSYCLRAEVFDGPAKLKTFESSSFVAAGNGPQTVSLSSEWPGARFWNLNAPYLYRARLTLLDSRGKALDTCLPVKFGFRQVQAKGRFLLLNGRKVTLFSPMTTPNMDGEGYFVWMKRMGFNWVPSNHMGAFFMSAGASHDRLWDEDLELLDQLGLAADLGVGSSLGRLIGPAKLQSDPEVIGTRERMMAYPIKRYRNHPSLFFYLGPHGGSVPNPGAMINGFLMDGRWTTDVSGQPDMADLFKYYDDQIATCHRLDPTRLYTAQDAGNYGDTVHITHYAGWMSNQEIADANEIWVKYGTKPYLITEQAAPFSFNWTDATRKAGYGSQFLVPYFAEWAAISHGDEAYARTKLDVEQLNRYEGVARTNPSAINWALFDAYENLADPDPGKSIYYRVELERKGEQVLNWRTFNITAYCDWMTAGEHVARVLHQDVFRDVVGYIGGDPKHLTDRSVNYRPGETMTKSLVGLNNGNDDVEAEWHYVLTVDGKKAPEKRVRVTLKAGETTLLPVSFTMPDRDTAEGTLEASLFVGSKESRSDRFAFNVIRPGAPKHIGQIALIDPEFATRALLERLHVPFTLLNFGEDFKGYDLLILGRRALSYEKAYRTAGFDIGRYLDGGGNLLVMPQEESVLRSRLGFRTEYIGSRFAYVRDPRSPALKGITNRSLRNWRGSASLVDPYQVSRNESGKPLHHNLTQWDYLWNDGTEHARPFKWGDRGTLATVVIHKPERGNFSPLLDCEFNLDYTPLLEYRSGKGKAVFCQLDLENRTEDLFSPTSDPAADRICLNLVAYLSQADPVALKPVVYLGGPTGQALLRKLRVPFAPVARAADLAPGHLLVVGEMTPTGAARDAAEVKRFVEEGGVAFVLHQETEALDALLSFSHRVVPCRVHQTLLGRATDPLLRGLGNADFYWKGTIDVNSLTSLPPGSFALDTGILARVPQGKGSYVVLQVGPDSFPFDKAKFEQAQADRLDRERRKVVETPEQRQQRAEQEQAFNAFYVADSQRIISRTINRLLDNLDARLAENLHLAASSGEAADVSLDLAGEWLICPATADEKSPPADGPRWLKIQVPGYWEDQIAQMKDYDGYVWYRRVFDCPDQLGPDAKVALHIGAVDDEDWTYLNGEMIGHLGVDTEPNSYWYARREYELTPEQVKRGLLRKGENVLTIRVNDLRGSGGIWPGPVSIFYSDPRITREINARRSLYTNQDVGRLDDPYMYQGW